MSKNRPGFDIQVEYGENSENILKQIIADGSDIEVKTENCTWADSGNMAIELEWDDRPSGITATESTHWYHKFALRENDIFSIYFLHRYYVIWLSTLKPMGE
jgi:hypothetical protein